MGSSLWHSLHTISFNYPVKPTRNDKKNYKRFIMDLKYVLHMESVGKTCQKI